MHQLVIDVREAVRPHRTGKGEWTYGFVSELLRRRHPVTLVTDADLPQEWLERGARSERISGRGLLWHLHVLAWLRRHPGVTYVSPVSYIVPAFAPRSVRCIPVIHDLIAFRGEPHDRKASLIERLMLPRVVRTSSRICVISQATKRDLLARYPSIASDDVTPLFAGPMTEHPPASEPDGRTIVCIATLCPRKNQLRLIRAFASLPPEIRGSHRLILAGGRGWDDDEIVRAAQSTEGVEWVGYIDRAGYDRLLHTCTVFALPSLYEGFGMQILDALQRGVPVLTSDRGSLKELAGDAALVVDPGDTDSIARGLQSLLADPALRSAFARKGPPKASEYSWKRTVDLFLASL